jgi:hypothetical protein
MFCCKTMFVANVVNGCGRENKTEGALVQETSTYGLSTVERSSIDVLEFAETVPFVNRVTRWYLLPFSNR